LSLTNVFLNHNASLGAAFLFIFNSVSKLENNRWKYKVRVLNFIHKGVQLSKLICLNFYYLKVVVSGSGYFFAAQVGTATSGSIKFHTKSQIFNCYTFRSKNNISLVNLGQSRVYPLFTLGQKYVGMATEGQRMPCVVMGPGQKFLAQVRPGQFFCGSGRVSHLWLGFEFGKFPLKMSNFSISFPSDQKNIFGSGRRRAGLLFTAGLKQAWVGSGPISTRKSWYWNLPMSRLAIRKLQNCFWSLDFSQI